MANLMTGILCEVIAQQDADLYAGIIGNGNLVPYVLNVGDKMTASIVDNNHIRIASGICVKEGRVFNIDYGSFDEFEIPNGEQGKTTTRYIGYKIFADESGKDSIQQEIGTSKRETAGLRSGDSSMYVWLYKVTQNGITISSVSPIFTSVPSLADLPVIRYGTAVPSNSLGKDGDIYIRLV